MTTDAAPVATGHTVDDATFRDVAAVVGARFGDRARKIIKVIRPLGWVLMALTVAFWTVAQILGWAEFAFAAIVLLAIVLVCAAFLIGRTEYDISLDLARTRVVVGERAVGALNLANRSSRAILPSRVVLPVGSGRGEFSIARLAPGTETEQLFAIPTQRRTVMEVGPVSVVRGDPLGLFERSHNRDEPVDLYVHPRTVRFGGQSLGFLRDLEGLPAADLSRDDVSFHALTEYQPGDDLRHVHWKSTARTGVMMMRQYEETRRSHFVIGLSTSTADYTDEDEFEVAISVAGSVGLRALQDSHQVELRVQLRTLPTRTGKQMLDSLSALEDSKPREGDIAGLAASIAANVALASIVVLVCGARASNEQLQMACSRLPFGARALVIVVKQGQEMPELRRIGDADVVTIGELEQLPRTLARVLA